MTCRSACVSVRTRSSRPCRPTPTLHSRETKSSTGDFFMQDLKGKTLFITGGASGIGFGITQVLLDAGMNAVIGDIRQDHIDEALDFFEKKQQRQRVHAIKVDITDRDAMKAAADETERKFGKVHVVINNAGVDPSGPFKQATYADWDFGMGVNLGGVING